jgi:hypothetical protein
MITVLMGLVGIGCLVVGVVLGGVMERRWIVRELDQGQVILDDKWYVVAACENIARSEENHAGSGSSESE